METGGQSGGTGPMQTTSLSILVNADKGLPSSFSGPAFTPGHLSQPLSCHTILPPPRPLATLDLTLP